MKKIGVGTIFNLLGFGLICFVTLFPLYWMLQMSLLPETEVMAGSLRYFPRLSVLTTHTYQEIITKNSLFTYLLNSIIIVVPASFVTLGLSFPVAYSLAKYQFRFKNYVYYGIIWLLGIPWVVYVLPIFKIVSNFDLLDTHLLMIVLYGFSGIPLMTWFIIPYLQDFPDELIDAGRLDGCSEWGIIWRVVVPALKNAFIALFILRFAGCYNDLLFSLSFTFNRAKMIMPAILEVPGLYEMPFAKMAASGVMAVAPILIISILSQRYVISGLTGRTIK